MYTKLPSLYPFARRKISYGRQSNPFRPLFFFFFCFIVYKTSIWLKLTADSKSKKIAMPPALGRPLTMLADGAYILRRAQESYHGQRRSRNPQPVVLSAVWRSLVAMVNRYRPSRLMVFFEGDAQVQASPQQAVPEFRLMPAFSPEERMDAHRLKRQPQRTTADKPMLPLLDRKSLVPGYKSNRNTVPPFAHWKIDGGASAVRRGQGKNTEVE